MFQDRFETLRDNLLRSGHEHTVQEVAGRLVGVLSNADEYLDRNGLYSDDTSLGAMFLREMREALNGLRTALSHPEAAVLEWVERTSGTFGTLFGEMSRVEKPQDTQLWDFARILQDIEHQSSLMQDKLIFAMEQARILSQASESLERTLSTEEKAKESTGRTGGTALSSHFHRFATGQLWAAEILRLLTVAGVGAALFFALKLGEIASGDWTQIAYRGATIAALGTLATYFARQAGQHRRMYNWARSLEVQLLSFPAFIEPLSVDEKSEAYRVLARRVLSAPPEKGAEVAEENIGAAQLVDLATALAKRS